MKVVCILIVCFAAIGCSMAREITREGNRLDINSINNTEHSDMSSSLIESRKRKPHHDLFFLPRKSGFSTVHVKPLHGIALMGGLQSLVGYIVIKIKIVLMTIAIIGVVALTLKVFGVFKYAGHFYKNDYPPIAPTIEYHGYPGSPSYPPISYDHDTYVKDWSSHAEHYARSTGHQFPINANMTEIMHSVMHVDKDDCRARLVCELEMMMTRSPLLNYFMRYAVTKHQSPSSPSRSEDCTAYYTKCVESSAKRLLRRRRRSRVKRGDSR